MDFPPFPGAFGQRLFDSVSKEAWAGWVRMQTMIVNENRLSMADAKHRKYLMEQCEKYFFGEGLNAPEGFVPR
jgi:Fe-S cluster biosynthesis and repair protein YggX